jgi:hypothetical protein
MSQYFAYIKPEPVSGIEVVDSLQINPGLYSKSEFVIIKSKDDFQAILNIKVESDYSPIFKQAAVLNDVVIIGYGNQFLILNYTTKEVRLKKVLNGYFNEFKIDGNEIFVATDSELFCLNEEGKQVWNTENLGIDGVRIESIDKTQIKGFGEWDPPGGWEEFILERKTGRKTPANNK